MFQQIEKNPNLGPFWSLFAQIWAKINFPRKKALLVFKYSHYQQSGKNQKKLMTHS